MAGFLNGGCITTGEVHVLCLRYILNRHKNHWIVQYNIIITQSHIKVMFISRCKIHEGRMWNSDMLQLLDPKCSTKLA